MKHRENNPHSRSVHYTKIILLQGISNVKGKNTVYIIYMVFQKGYEQCVKESYQGLLFCNKSCIMPLATGKNAHYASERLQNYEKTENEL